MKCRSIREGFQITRGHSSLCRQRICEQMKSEGNVADLEKADERKMRYYAREVEQADRESKKARFVAPETHKKSCHRTVEGRLRARRYGSHLVREVEKKRKWHENQDVLRRESVMEMKLRMRGLIDIKQYKMTTRTS